MYNNDRHGWDRRNGVCDPYGKIDLNFPWFPKARPLLGPPFLLSDLFRSSVWCVWLYGNDLPTGSMARR